METEFSATIRKLDRPERNTSPMVLPCPFSHLGWTAYTPGASRGGEEDGGDGADDHGDGGVGDGVVQVAGVTADDGQQGTLEESQQDGVDHRATQGAPDGHGTAVAGLVPVILPQRPGHGTGIADAEGCSGRSSGCTPAGRGRLRRWCWRHRSGRQTRCPPCM